jgi:glycerol-1-phosphate dehydrogenase [NAD(P)+]
MARDADPFTSIMIGEPFEVAEVSLADVLSGVGAYTAVVNDPPWSLIARAFPKPVRVVVAGGMDLAELEAMAAREDGGRTVVGIGGGTAMDTAKYMAWKHSKPLIQVPTITSVDAAFTDAIGVRQDQRVRYIAKVVPRLVVLDLPLIRSAPPHLNRAGVGDVLSCHTGLFDWKLASNAGHGHPWRADLAALGAELLAGLETAAGEIRTVSADGVRFLAHAYRRIGAACAQAGHSRFEEGSEHFWAYAYEAQTGVSQIHGELIACGVVALSVVQGNDPDRAADIVAHSGVRAHPADLGITEAQFRVALTGLAAYARAENLDVSVADLKPVTAAQVDAAWRAVCALPRA